MPDKTPLTDSAPPPVLDIAEAAEPWTPPEPEIPMELMPLGALERAAESLVSAAELPELMLHRGSVKRGWVTERLALVAVNELSRRLIPYLIELAVARLRRSTLRP